MWFDGCNASMSQATSANTQMTQSERKGKKLAFYNHHGLSCFQSVLIRTSSLNKSEEKKITASAGNRTRINCLEGSYADHYTTDADIGKWKIFYLVI